VELGLDKDYQESPLLSCLVGIEMKKIQTYVMPPDRWMMIRECSDCFQNSSKFLNEFRECWGEPEDFKGFYI